MPKLLASIIMIALSALMTENAVTIALGGDPIYPGFHESAADSAFFAVLLGLMAIFLLLLALSASLADKIEKRKLG